MGPAPVFAASEAVAAMLGMTSIGISLCTQPMYASDRLAERLEDRQFVLGEGPLVEAFTTRLACEATDRVTRLGTVGCRWTSTPKASAPRSRSR